jgi:hypothetical protein
VALASALFASGARAGAGACAPGPARAEPRRATVVRQPTAAERATLAVAARAFEAVQQGEWLLGHCLMSAFEASDERGAPRFAGRLTRYGADRAPAFEPPPQWTLPGRLDAPVLEVHDATGARAPIRCTFVSVEGNLRDGLAPFLLQAHRVELQAIAVGARGISATLRSEVEGAAGSDRMQVIAYGGEDWVLQIERTCSHAREPSAARATREVAFDESCELRADRMEVTEREGEFRATTEVAARLRVQGTQRLSGAADPGRGQGASLATRSRARGELTVRDGPLTLTAADVSYAIDADWSEARFEADARGDVVIDGAVVARVVSPNGHLEFAPPQGPQRGQARRTPRERRR